MTNTKRISTVVCLDCEEIMSVSAKTKLGDILNCLFCESQMEVVSLNPIRIDWASSDDLDDDLFDAFADDDDDDWDDDWDDDL